MTVTGLEPTTTYFVNEHSTILPNWPNDEAVLWVLICTVDLTVCSYHVRISDNYIWHSGNYRVWNHSEMRINLSSLGFILKNFKYALCEKCPNMEFFLVCVFPYSVQIREQTDQKKLRIWTLFTQWWLTSLYYVIV